MGISMALRQMGLDVLAERERGGVGMGEAEVVVREVVHTGGVGGMEMGGVGLG